MGFDCFMAELDSVFQPVWTLFCKLFVCSGKIFFLVFPFLFFFSLFRAIYYICHGSKEED